MTAELREDDLIASIPCVPADLLIVAVVVAVIRVVVSASHAVSHFSPPPPGFPPVLHQVPCRSRHLLLQWF